MRLKSRKVVGTLAVVASVLFSCSTTSTHELNPTPARPIIMCHISCPSGYMFRRQHICHGNRLFEDILVIGQDEINGNPSESRWYTQGAAYYKMDVEVGTCHSVIAQIIAGRDREKRGVHPGEDGWGEPLIPQP